MEAAIAYALSAPASAGPAGAPAGEATRPPGPHYPDGLTEREVDVLRLITAGMSNQEIAQALVLSLRTVSGTPPTST